LQNNTKLSKFHSFNSKKPQEDYENDRLEDLFDEHWNDFDHW